MSMADESMKMRMTQQRLARSELERLRASAAFPLRVAQMCQDMAKLISIRDYGDQPLSEESMEYLRMQEQEIKKVYRETFGTEYGQ
jgi:hypothetical protein